MGSQKGKRYLPPRDIVTIGKLPTDALIVGTVVRVREIKRDENSISQSTCAKGDGNKAKKGVRSAVGKSKSDECLEIHLPGGKSPTDVMTLTAWEDSSRATLRPHVALGTNIVVSKVFVKEHTEQTLAWITARHPLYAIIDATSVVEIYEECVTWPSYHPVTLLNSLQHVNNHSLVCLAGMVLPPGPQTKEEKLGADTVRITFFKIRVGNTVVNAEAWHDAADYAAELLSGKVYFFEGIKRIAPDAGRPDISNVRYLVQTRHGKCPQSLEHLIICSTVDELVGVSSISPELINRILLNALTGCRCL